MAIWRDDVYAALNDLGGEGSLAEIYGAVHKLREPPIPSNWEAIIRRELEHNSSDSRVFKKRFDLFRSIGGIGSGKWAIRGHQGTEEQTGGDVSEPPSSVLTQIMRIVRDTPMIRKLKTLYLNRCQICRTVLVAQDGSHYSEGHHVKPLSEQHGGPDSRDNILILCPNCHAQCDMGFIALEGELMEWKDGHRVRDEYIDYHNLKIVRRPS